MKNLWSDRDARACVRRYGRQDVNADVARRIYTARLLGGDPQLVLHGGGNTSVKTVATDITGEVIDVLCVKGSGWDMGDIEPPGLPAVRLDPLRQLHSLDSLSDEEMVNVQRRNLLDSKSPNPSVETLLHAFLPHKYVDHTHSTAVLALTDQPDGAKICRDLYGDRVALVPYIMPGFALAKACAQVHAKHPGVEGLILLKHGIFTFGESAEEAYGRMIDLVSLAERRLKTGRRNPVFATPKAKPRLAKVADIAPRLRGMLAQGEDENQKRFVMTFRTSAAIRRFVSDPAAKRYSQQGTVTPDHAIRIKPKPVILPTPARDDLDGFFRGAARAIKQYEKAYRGYFDRQNDPADPRTPLDPAPRVLLVPGLGFFAAGGNAGAASVAADVYENNIEVITDAEAIGRYRSISESDTFDIEHWSLEQAKLGSAKEKPLARQIVVITGAGGAIGQATARAFGAAGAEVALLDLNTRAIAPLAEELGGVAVACDVTRDRDVARALAVVCERFGGLDILVSNAGAAWQGRIGEVDEKLLRESFELNFFAHQRVASAAVAIMRAQGTGGVLLFNTSKQAVNPGKDFGPYGLPKAATLFLSRQYALDHGADGIRSNAVNADRIRSGLLTDKMVQARSTARGLSEEDYMAGNLLGREVLAEDVARAFVDLALADKTTAAVLTVDGGNIEAALR
ncbi:MAG: bifunctional aldolase/short-chain dehydrogenase [Rhodospirillaceae bacterium]|jgi:rhamnose utilization protein RhaD (predicted bifunctional aldolase and dehydrogenase)/NAD(P)-dependent dehydrogenase (short-subunit alcohol dehydrogenase family)|nr:bifunctional aldolase/short-chain dehydrogenase [Rhodospirillaceae bacterium]MBT5944891.1 bifunctional aldolase/short-chain dehydrogenase [Rhodospirillaceae bacterium]MBT6405489.1 bifunctional aldolase/short-chain dehydrogenase [Rhodospirillaceae bacterium]MBT6535675.1 bifunctional aldolase/short-chain dehydrogenase [Rhodospirillaceae bacterium]MBT7361988.1 bifunctional aldolase/short-chain dehydrogenase [Rhodospirillaceae bacterium]